MSADLILPVKPAAALALNENVTVSPPTGTTGDDVKVTLKSEIVPLLFSRCTPQTGGLAAVHPGVQPTGSTSVKVAVEPHVRGSSRVFGVHWNEAGEPAADVETVFVVGAAVTPVSGLTQSSCL